jgi:hypothetical protein
MSEYAIIFQVLAALLALFFIFLTYMNTKTWRWVHVTMMVLVFSASIAFCFYAAMALKTRAAWLKTFDDLTRDVETTSGQLALVSYGDPKDIQNKTPSVTSLREELGRTIIDRGRIWRGCTPTFNADGTATVATVPPPDPNLPPPPVKKNNIAPKTILHVFREVQTPDGWSVPANYIGEFEATAGTDTSVTLRWTMPLAADQQAAAQQPGTWVLYETCPVDGHEWFAGMDQAAVQAVFPQQLFQGVPPQQYQKLIESYVRDGQRAEDNDPLENIWIEVKFLQKHEIIVDAAAPTTSFDAELQYFPFNAEGQAVLDRLRRPTPPGSTVAAGTVVFGPGLGQIQTAVLDQQTAESLVAQGICEKVRPIFRRKLNDYEQKFHSTHLRVVDMTDRMRQLTLDNQALVASTDKANQQSMLVEELKTKLTDDLNKAKFEQAELTKYSQSLDARLVAVQTQLSELYRSNKAVSRELTKINDDLTREIERRTREATASAP